MPQALNLDDVIRFERKWIAARRSKDDLSDVARNDDPAPIELCDLEGHFRKLAGTRGTAPHISVELAAEAKAKEVAQREIHRALQMALDWFFADRLPRDDDDRTTAKAMGHVVRSLLDQLRAAIGESAAGTPVDLAVLVNRAHDTLQLQDATVHDCKTIAERQGKAAAIALCKEADPDKTPAAPTTDRFRRAAEDASAAALRLVSEEIARRVLAAHKEGKAGDTRGWFGRKVDILADIERVGVLFKKLAAHRADEAEEDTTERPAVSLHNLLTDEPDEIDHKALSGLDEALAHRIATDSGTRPQDGLVGLALSGGGVRSASFNLGVLQALHEVGLFGKIDYLSTVSGGGYVGSCVSSIYAGGAEAFPFDHNPGEPEKRAFKHLRNHSNYLAPGGFLDWVRIAALLLRSTLSNFLIVLPLILLAAAVTVWAIYDTVPLSQQIGDAWLDMVVGLLVDWPRLATFLNGLGNLVSVLTAPSLPFTSAAAWALAISFVLETVSRTRKEWRTWQARNSLGRISAVLLVVTLGAFVIEIQPVIVETYGLKTNDILIDWLTLFVSLAGPGSALLASRVAQRAPVKSFLRKLPHILVGVLGPLVIYLIYLLLARWGAFPETAPEAVVYMRTATAHFLEMVTAWGAPFGNMIAEWNIWASDQVALLQASWMSAQQATTSWFYGLAALVLFLIMTLFGNVNLSSPHMFYRDRLARAFVFKVSDDGRVEPNDDQPLSALLARAPAPYHLVNATLNLTTARQDPTRRLVNRDGEEAPGVPTGAWAARRSADFFLFSPGFSGSVRTGYCPTGALELADGHMGLASAMAISGAAAAPFSGVVTNRALGFLMVLFNIRLGYWVPNPSEIGNERSGPIRRLLGYYNPGPSYLYLELFGLLGDGGRCVNVSDGGHIENLGVYELLRRHCRLIIASDAEHDPNYSFEGLARLQMMARVDLGIDIRFDPADLKAIRKAEKGGEATQPYAIGMIRYSNGDTGRLIYLKSCVTGKERVYIKSYRNVNEEFPHQSTGDQFFDETQFECYRGLGYSLATETFSSPYEEVEAPAGTGDGGTEASDGHAPPPPDDDRGVAQVTDLTVAR